MATNVVLVAGVQLGTSISTLYTSPSNGGGTRVIQFTLTNDNAAPQTYDLHVVPSGGSADATNRIINNRSLAATGASGHTDVPAEIQNVFMDPSATIQALSSATTSITVRASGIEF